MLTVAVPPLNRLWSQVDIISLSIVTEYGLITSSSYGTAKSGVGVSAMAVLRPDLMMKCCIPVVMAGIIGVRFFFLAPPSLSR